jgi:hypothetical protein
MKRNAKWGRVGQSFDDFLKEEGRYEESSRQAVKRALAFRLSEAMERQSLTKAAMARKLKTSRSQLDRLLDPDNTKVTRGACRGAGTAVGIVVVFKRLHHHAEVFNWHATIFSIPSRAAGDGCSC